jgi:hypothetical protein
MDNTVHIWCVRSGVTRREMCTLYPPPIGHHGVKPYAGTMNARRGLYSMLTLKGDVQPSQPGQFCMLRGDWGADPLFG